MPTGLSRRSPKGLTYPFLPGAAGADVTALVDGVDRYVFDQWAQDADTSGALVYGYRGGSIVSGASYAIVNGGTVALDDDATNYVERDGNGVITSNTTGFTGTKTPMAIVVTATGRIQRVQDTRLLSTGPGTPGGGIGGSGTANRVSKFTASATIGDSQILDNGSVVVMGTDPGGSEFLRIGGSLRVSGAVAMVALLTLSNGITVSAGAVTVPNASIAWTALSGVPSTFTPSAHQLDSATYHTVSGLTAGRFLKALTATTFGFAVHGLAYGDVGAAAASHAHAWGDITSGVPTTIGGYGITDFNSLGDARWSLLAHTHAGAYEPVLGNPAATGYVLSSTDAGVRSWITKANWDTAYGWGNHASAGYAVAASYTGSTTIVTLGTITTGTVPWARLSDVPSSFTPAAHALIDATGHTASALTTGHFLKATGATTYGFAAHGLTYSDVGAAPAAGSSSIVTVGALNAGSITSGFGGAVFGGDVTIPAHDLTIGTAAGTYFRLRQTDGYPIFQRNAGAGTTAFQTLIYSSDAQAGVWLVQRARGTVALPSAVLAKDYLWKIAVKGYMATGFSTGSATIGVYAAENWTDATNAAGMVFMTTASGAITDSARWAITSAGHLVAGWPGELAGPAGDNEYDIGLAAGTNRPRTGYFGTSVVVQGTTDATSSITGALITAGGLGVAKALWVGGLGNFAGAITSSGLLVQKDQNAATRLQVINVTSGASGQSGIQVSTDLAGSYGLIVGALSSGFNAGGGYEALLANSATLTATSEMSNGLMLLTTHASAPIRFCTGSYGTAAEKARFTPTGALLLGTATDSSNRLVVLSTTTPQARIANTTAEYLTIAVGATGTTTYAIVTAGTALHTFGAQAVTMGALTTSGAINAGANALTCGAITATTGTFTDIVTATGANGGYSLHRRDTNVLRWTIYSAAGDLQFYLSAVGDKMALSDTGALTLAAGLTCTTITASGLLTANAGLTVASGQTLTLTGATVTGLTAASVGAGTFAGAMVFGSTVEMQSTLKIGGLTYTWPGSQTNGYVLSTNGSGTLSWIANAALVSSVAGRTGAVVLTAADVGAGTFPGANYAFNDSVLSGLLTLALRGPLTVADVNGSSNSKIIIRDDWCTDVNAGPYGLSFHERISNSPVTVGEIALITAYRADSTPGSNAGKILFYVGSGDGITNVQVLELGADASVSYYGTIHVDADLARPFRIKKSTVAVVAAGAGYGLVRWEAGTNAGTLKLVAYAGTSTTGVTIVDNVGAGN